MNARDQKEFDAMLKKPDFENLYTEFCVAILFPLAKLDLPLAVDPLQADDIARGKSPKIFAFGNQEKIIVFTALLRQAEHYARRLSVFFPASRRYYWQELFLHQASHGTGYVFQRQSGGRAKKTRPQSAKQKYRRIINLRESAVWRFRTDREFLDAYPEYNLSQLARAKRWNAEGKP